MSRFSIYPVEMIRYISRNSIICLTLSPRQNCRNLKDFAEKQKSSFPQQASLRTGLFSYHKKEVNK